jgi:DNA-binding Lrp family transcriptional regulator
MHRKVLESLKRVKGVEEANALYSVHDLALRVKVNSVDKLKKLITFSTRLLSGVYNVTALLLVE